MEIILLAAGLLVLLSAIKYNFMLHFVGLAIMANYLALGSAYTLSKVSDALVLGVLNVMFIQYYLILLFFFITRWLY
jgi:hypothetical protein